MLIGVKMDRIVKDVKNLSGNYWFPEESFDISKTNEDRSDDEFGVPDINKVIDKWRLEREGLVKKKEVDRKKSFMKKQKHTDTRRKKDNEKVEHKKHLELALQNSLKNRNDCGLLLAELEYFDNESQQRLDLAMTNPDSPSWSNFDFAFRPHSTASDTDEAKYREAQTLKRVFSQQPALKNINDIDTDKKNAFLCSKNCVHKTLIDEVFARLKKQQESVSELHMREGPGQDNFFQESYHVLKDLYNKEVQSLNIKGGDINYLQHNFDAFPPFPATIQELDFISNNPLIIFREWCHFHHLTPLSLEKVTKESLLNDFMSTATNDNIRLNCLCTLMNLYYEGGPVNKVHSDCEFLLRCHDLQIPSTSKQDELGYALNSVLKHSFGKIQLGSALALALTDRSNENRDLISSTLMMAVKGITTVEKRLAALAMAYAGIFEHTALHVLLEEWKAAQHVHTLHQYLTGLRWLSIHENSIIRSVAEFLTSRNLPFRFYVCLTLPFLEGPLATNVKDVLIHLMRFSSAYILRLAAARVLEWKQRGDCVQEHILMSMNSSNVLKALEVIQLSVVLRNINPKITDILVPCLQSKLKEVKLIALNVIENNCFKNPNAIQKITNLISDKDPEIRESALNTLRAIGAHGHEIETTVLSTLISENNENVLTAVLKLLPGIDIKPYIVYKALHTTLKKPHSKGNQLLIVDLIENMKLEEDNGSSSKLVPRLTALEGSKLEITSCGTGSFQNISQVQGISSSQEIKSKSKLLSVKEYVNSKHNQVGKTSIPSKQSLISSIKKNINIGGK